MKTHVFFFFSWYRFSVSSITDGHGLFARMDGQINSYRDGGGSERTLHPADWNLHPSFLSHERSPIFMGGSFFTGNEQIFWDWFTANLFVLPAGRSLIYWSVVKDPKGGSVMCHSGGTAGSDFRRDSALPRFPLSVLHPLSHSRWIRTPHTTAVTRATPWENKSLS